MGGVCSPLHRRLPRPPSGGLPASTPAIRLRARRAQDLAPARRIGWRVDQGKLMGMTMPRRRAAMAGARAAELAVMAVMALSGCGGAVEAVLVGGSA